MRQTANKFSQTANKFRLRISFKVICLRCNQESKCIQDFVSTQRNLQQCVSKPKMSGCPRVNPLTHISRCLCISDTVCVLVRDDGWCVSTPHHPGIVLLIAGSCARNLHSEQSIQSIHLYTHLSPPLLRGSPPLSSQASLWCKHLRNLNLEFIQ